MKRSDNMEQMTDADKLNWVHFAIQEALNGNLDELEQALYLVEDVRENCGDE